MTGNARPTPTDTDLVAYLDGELSPADSVRIGQAIAVDRAVADRLHLLMSGARSFRTAFAPLLDEAPSDRLDAMLAGLLETPKAPRRLAEWPRRVWPMAIAASLVFMAAGAGLDRWVVGHGVPSASLDDQEGWRRAVTQYLSLYTSETLSMIPDSEATRRQELASVGGRLGLDLDEARVALPGVSLKRAEMFDYDGQALAFLAYLDPKSGPLSLCILARGQADAPPRVEQRRGMTVVYWSRSGHGFMLIGRGDAEALRARAEQVASRFGGMTGDPSQQPG